MFRKSALEKEIERWLKNGSGLDTAFLSIGHDPVRSKAEVRAICSALEFLHESTIERTDRTRSPLHFLTALFQNVEGQDVSELLKKDGLPCLRIWAHDLIDGRRTDPDALMFILKILAMYRQLEDVEVIAKAVRKPIEADGFMWSMIFGQFDTEHPYSVDMVNALRDPLPTDFILVAYLDMSNALSIAKNLDQHPFDSRVGRTYLKGWLLDTNEENFSYAHSATAALPFIERSSQEQLLRIASSHSDPTVRLESAWARAKAGDMVGVDHLAKFCLIPAHSSTAQRYLEELGRSSAIPAEVRDPGFQAIAEMANWLAHPSEFGRPPDEIELFDTRELFWPPTIDSRRVWLLKYSFDEKENGESALGIGMVGSVTFALFGEATADLSAEEVYGLHCCWELEMNGDPRAPATRTADSGRAILSKQNPGFI